MCVCVGGGGGGGGTKAQGLERWYVKTESLGSIPGWGSQMTFPNSSHSTSFDSLYIILMNTTETSYFVPSIAANNVVFFELRL